jgi:hypothetical protein
LFVFVVGLYVLLSLRMLFISLILWPLAAPSRLNRSANDFEARGCVTKM